MNRNVLLGAGLAATLAVAVLALTGGNAPAATPAAPAPARQAPSPNLEGVAAPAPQPAAAH